LNSQTVAKRVFLIFKRINLKAKHFVFFMVATLMCNVVMSQHCGYDHSALIGIRPMHKDGQIINGLRITLVDAQGKPVIVSKSIYKRDKYVSSYNDTAEFWRNPIPTKEDHMSIREEEKRHFLQAGQDYIIITGSYGRNEKGRYVRIEDIDGEANGGYFNTKIIFVKPEHIQALCGYPNERPFNQDYKPLIVSLDKYKDKSQFITTKTLNGFTFMYDKSPLAPCPECKGCYCQLFMVYAPDRSILFNQLFTFQEQTEKLLPQIDSFQVGDYNFDGYPDFRVCSNSAPGKHIYYIYHKKRNTYLIEKTLTELNGLNFDFINKTAKGHTERKEFMGYPWNAPHQYYMETLQFEGNRLENLTVTTTVYGGSTYISEKCKYINQKRIYEGDSIGLELQKKNLLIKEVGPFKFEMEFNPEEYKTSGEKGAYLKILNIYKGERTVGHFEMHGNYLSEVPHWLDSLEIADFNFDGYPDIRMYNSNMGNSSYVYLLFNADKDVQQFYQETLFSLAVETEFIPNQKIWKGKIVESNLTRYLFLKNDTLTITIQDNDLTKPPFIEESIYKNGNRKGLRSAYGKLEPDVKKEYGDYNFDGYEDFRQQSKKSPYYWDVFIYNSAKESFEKDTLMSKFMVFNYNKQQKKLDGYYRITLDETSWQTKYYQWSFTDKKMMLYQEQVCYSKSPRSENYRCVTSRLVDGKWIDTETFGAE